MRLLIVAAVVAITSAAVPELKIRSIELPEPPVPKDETAYVPRIEPISFGMLMVPQEVLDAVAAEQANYLLPLEPVQVADVPAFEPISLGELETLIIATPQDTETMDVAEPVKVVDAPMEFVESNQESIVEPVKVADMSTFEMMYEVEPVEVVDAPIENVVNNQESIVDPVKVVRPPFPEIPIDAIYPDYRYTDPYLR